MSKLTNTSGNSLHTYNNKDENYSDISQDNNVKISSYETLTSKIKSLPIKDVVVREGTQLKKQGSSYKALCCKQGEFHPKLLTECRPASRHLIYLQDTFGMFDFLFSRYT